jgi:hypothetical protein
LKCTTFRRACAKDDQREEHLEADRGDGEEIERDELWHMVL